MTDKLVKVKAEVYDLKEALEVSQATTSKIVQAVVQKFGINGAEVTTIEALLEAIEGVDFEAPDIVGQPVEK